jgi:ribbon-helix-helix CopG family protein
MTREYKKRITTVYLDRSLLDELTTMAQQSNRSRSALAEAFIHRGVNESKKYKSGDLQRDDMHKHLLLLVRVCQAQRDGREHTLTLIGAALSELLGETIVVSSHSSSELLAVANNERQGPE